MRLENFVTVEAGEETMNLQTDEYRKVLNKRLFIYLYNLT